MRSRLDRSVALLTICVLSATGCVSVVGIDAERSIPDQVQHFMWDLPQYPDVATTLIGTEPNDPYRVGPLDEISVQVFGRLDLGSQAESVYGSRSSMVGEGGSIHLPFIGKLHVAGLTRHAIASLVNERYAEIVQNAQVDVQIVRCGSKPVDLVGAFSAPGRYYVCENLRTVGAVLGAAQGLTVEANPARGTLTRGGITYHLDPLYRRDGNPSPLDALLKAGDVIHFPVVGERTVYVFGQVITPGPYSIPPQGMGLLELLAKAKGWDAETMSESIYLLRPTNEMVVAWKLDLSELLQSQSVPLMDGDRLYVAPTWLARWHWWWRQAIPQFLIPRYTLF
jgi:polysaccharide export outer membrane protein